mgnify:FL=1
MTTRLSAEDVEVLIGLVRAEVNRIVDEKVGELRQGVSQALVDLAIGQLKYLGVEVAPMPQQPVEQSANGNG